MWNERNLVRDGKALRGTEVNVGIFLQALCLLTKRARLVENVIRCFKLLLEGK